MTLASPLLQAVPGVAAADGQAIAKPVGQRLAPLGAGASAHQDDHQDEDAQEDGPQGDQQDEVQPELLDHSARPPFAANSSAGTETPRSAILSTNRGRRPVGFSVPRKRPFSSIPAL